MQIIRNITTDLIQYSFFDNDTVVIGANDMTASGVRALDIKSSTHQLIENVTLPTNFFVGVYNYDNGSFPIGNQTAWDQRLQDAKDSKIKNIDAQTSKDILELASETDQRNLTASAIELLQKEVDGSISSAETAELGEIKALWASIKTLRVDGNAKEVLVQDATTFESVAAI